MNRDSGDLTKGKRERRLTQTLQFVRVLAEQFAHILDIGLRNVQDVLLRHRRKHDDLDGGCEGEERLGSHRESLEIV